MSPTHFRHYTDLHITTFFLLTKIEISVFFKTYAQLFTQILSPIIYYLFIATALAKTVGFINFQSVKITYNEYALIGLLSMSIIGQMSRLIYRVTMDRRYGLFALKMQNGVPPLCYLLVASTSSIIGYLIQASVFAVIIFLFNLNIQAINFILAILIGLISLGFWLGLGIILTVCINNYQTRDVLLTFLIMPLSFSAPSFYIISDAPFFIQLLAIINPLTYQLQAIREAAFGIIQYSSLAIMLFLSLISLIIATITIRNAALSINEQV